MLPGPKETPNLPRFQKAEGTDGYLWYLLAYQSTCWPLSILSSYSTFQSACWSPCSIRILSTCSTVQSACWDPGCSQLFSLPSYPKFSPAQELPLPPSLTLLNFSYALSLTHILSAFLSLPPPRLSCTLPLSVSGLCSCFSHG